MDEDLYGDCIEIVDSDESVPAAHGLESDGFAEFSDEEMDDAMFGAADNTWGATQTAARGRLPQPRAAALTTTQPGAVAVVKAPTTDMAVNTAAEPEWADAMASCRAAVAGPGATAERSVPGARAAVAAAVASVADAAAALKADTISSARAAKTAAAAAPSSTANMDVCVTEAKEAQAVVVASLARVADGLERTTITQPQAPAPAAHCPAVVAELSSLRNALGTSQEEATKLRAASAAATTAATGHAVLPPQVTEFCAAVTDAIAERKAKGAIVAAEAECADEVYLAEAEGAGVSSLRLLHRELCDVRKERDALRRDTARFKTVFREARVGDVPALIQFITDARRQAFAPPLPAQEFPAQDMSSILMARPSADESDIAPLQAQTPEGAAMEPQPSALPAPPAGPSVSFQNHSMLAPSAVGFGAAAHKTMVTSDPFAATTAGLNASFDVPTDIAGRGSFAAPGATVSSTAGLLVTPARGLPARPAALRPIGVAAAAMSPIATPRVGTAAANQEAGVTVMAASPFSPVGGDPVTTFGAPGTASARIEAELKAAQAQVLHLEAKLAEVSAESAMHEARARDAKAQLQAATRAKRARETVDEDTKDAEAAPAATLPLSLGSVHSVAAVPRLFRDACTVTSALKGLFGWDIDVLRGDTARDALVLSGPTPSMPSPSMASPCAAQPSATFPASAPGDDVPIVLRLTHPATDDAAADVFIVELTGTAEPEPATPRAGVRSRKFVSEAHVELRTINGRAPAELGDSQGSVGLSKRLALCVAPPPPPPEPVVVTKTVEVRVEVPVPMPPLAAPAPLPMGPPAAIPTKAPSSDTAVLQPPAAAAAPAPAPVSAPSTTSSKQAPSFGASIFAAPPTTVAADDTGDDKASPKAAFGFSSFAAPTSGERQAASSPAPSFASNRAQRGTPVPGATESLGDEDEDAAADAATDMAQSDGSVARDADGEADVAVEDGEAAATERGPACASPGAEGAPQPTVDEDSIVTQEPGVSPIPVFKEQSPAPAMPPPSTPQSTGGSTMGTPSASFTFPFGGSLFSPQVTAAAPAADDATAPPQPPPSQPRSHGAPTRDVSTASVGARAVSCAEGASTHFEESKSRSHVPAPETPTNTPAEEAPIAAPSADAVPATQPTKSPAPADMAEGAAAVAESKPQAKKSRSRKRQPSVTFLEPMETPRADGSESDEAVPAPSDEPVEKKAKPEEAPPAAAEGPKKVEEAGPKPTFGFAVASPFAVVSKVPPPPKAKAEAKPDSKKDASKSDTKKGRKSKSPPPAGAAAPTAPPTPAAPAAAVEPDASVPESAVSTGVLAKTMVEDKTGTSGFTPAAELKKHLSTGGVAAMQDKPKAEAPEPALTAAPTFGFERFATKSASPVTASPFGFGSKGSSPTQPGAPGASIFGAPPKAGGFAAFGAAVGAAPVPAVSSGEKLPQLPVEKSTAFAAFAKASTPSVSPPPVGLLPTPDAAQAMANAAAGAVSNPFSSLAAPGGASGGFGAASAGVTTTGGAFEGLTRKRSRGPQSKSPEPK